MTVQSLMNLRVRFTLRHGELDEGESSSVGGTGWKSQRVVVCGARGTVCLGLLGAVPEIPRVPGSW
eukprot:3774928-Rhodomonas_salina.2